MQNYKIFTDSTSDLSPEQVEKYDVQVIAMGINIGDKTFSHYPDEREMSFKEFYDHLREGESSGTAAVSMGAWGEAFEQELQKGSDVLAVTFSAALSSTCDNARMAASELSEKYPERKIIVVDSSCASLGQGLLVKMASDWRAMGKSIEENANLLEDIKFKICHWFTVDDLAHLRRGGRISRGTAVVGTALGIKPILHVDDEGKLVGVGKVRGRKHSIRELVDQMEQTIIEPATQDIFITQGDCLQDAEALRREIVLRMRVKSITINYVGPVSGAHCGPGTLALFFVGSKR